MKKNLYIFRHESLNVTKYIIAENKQIAENILEDYKSEHIIKANYVIISIIRAVNNDSTMF